MSNALTQLADEAIQLEQNVSKLYLAFRDAHPEDADFWWKLAIEESNHAALIKSGRDYFMQVRAFPDEMLPPSIDELRQVNQHLTDALNRYETNPPSRQEAFNIALQIEKSAGEIHFQNTMSKATDSKILKLFQKLNQDDINHITRIRQHMIENEIAEIG